VFDSNANNLVANDTNNTGDIFLKDTQTGAIRRVSTSASDQQGNGVSWNASVSADGRDVVFASDANNLVAGDNNGTRDIFLKDTQTGAISRVSTSASDQQGNGWSFRA
jgi:Tol biopolymer transport system component